MSHANKQEKCDLSLLSSRTFFAYLYGECRQARNKRSGSERAWRGRGILFRYTANAVQRGEAKLFRVCMAWQRAAFGGVWMHVTGAEHALCKLSDMSAYDQA